MRGRWWAAAPGEAYGRVVALDSSRSAREGVREEIRLEKLGRGRIVIADGCYAMKMYPKSSSTHKI